MKKILCLLCVVLSIFMMSSCGSDNNVLDFKFDMSYEDIEKLCYNDEFFGEDKDNNMVGYKRQNVEFFENEDVISVFYFDDDSLSRVIYDVSTCSTENIDEMVEYFDDNYKQTTNENKTIGKYPLTHIEWEGNDIKITYEKMTIGNKSQIKFYFNKKD